MRDAREKFLDARQDEIRDVVFAGKATRPIEAAKRVKAGEGKNDWIPSPVTLGESMPASIAEVVALYQTNARVSAADERESNGFRPELSALPTPNEFQSVVKELNSLAAADLRFREELWDANRGPDDLNEFDRMLETANKTIEFLRNNAPWQLEAIQAGRDGDEARRVWVSFSELIETTWREVQECYALVVEYGPTISDTRPPHELLPLVEEIIEHSDKGNSFGMLTKLTKRHWFEFIEKARVSNRALDPKNISHLQAVRAEIRTRVLREDLLQRWGRLIACQGGPVCADLTEKPEQVCKQFVTRIQTCLEWHDSTWQPLESEFQRLGFFWAVYLESTPPETGANAELNRIRRAVLGDLGTILQSRSGWLRHKRLGKILAEWPESVPTSETPDAPVTQRLRRAMREASPTDYQAAYEELVRLKNLELDLANRHGLLRKISRSAPAWASAIENRNPKHDQPQPPGNPGSAWEWRQLYDELERRANVSLDELQQLIESLGSQLLEVTAQLVEKKTWVNQIRMTGSQQKQALGAYAAMRNRLTKTGKGVRDAELRNAARREMTTAKDAVPVWIMPLAEVAETFDPQKTRFDVVIVDESSQCDPTSLFALYLGRQTIIVGDDEQVSPVAVGEKSDEVVKLINTYLNGVPFKELYDGTTSVYDLAQIAFGGVIRLTEHFRCAPDIIAFSNNLSYKGEIKPLRDASSIPLNPHVVHYRVEGGRDRGDNVNEVEAEVIAALLCAATEQPDYAKNDQGKPTTFGVVSLVAHNQALKIDSILRQRLEPAEYQRRQILCGDSAQFQGDERDVMFLSVVDSPPAEPPLAMRQEGGKKIFKKRFNVATSRARNQMWIVHSLNHEVDLKVGDYRRNLIEHALDPNAWERELQKRMERTESIFEKRVLRRLMEAHYNVMPQFQVGAYRIDLVVNGNGHRLAVECDGERWHGPEKLREDAERQAILERLRWKFVRIRGSLFFRDEDRALKAMFARLEELNITPEIELSSSKPCAKEAVVEQVIRRAQELQASWRANGGPYTEALSAKEKNQMPTLPVRIGDEGAPKSVPTERRVISFADESLNQQGGSAPVQVAKITQASSPAVKPESSSPESGIVPPKDGRLHRSTHAEDLFNRVQVPFNQDGKRTVDLRKCCESSFEQEMYDELTQSGFRVTPQVQVGQYRIDMVVEGQNHARLAVEFDGNQYMGKDNFAHMQRQRILERAGWVFWRCSASAFSHRRKDILDDLLKTLAKRGIKPIGTEDAPSIVHTEQRVVPIADDSLNQGGSAPVEVAKITQASSPAVQPALLKRSGNKGFITRKKEYICPLLGAKFVLIPAGTFMMGSPFGESGRCDDERQHQVTISKPFYMQTTEVTQGQWKKGMGSNPSYFKNCGDDCPVENISWNDVQEFIGKLNQLEGMDKYRLPTEAQWEYAARAGTTTRFYSGDNDDDLSNAGWYSGNSRSMTHPVGQKTPNAWGLYDMHGNLWEWVYDLKGNYPSGIVTDPEGPSSGSYRMSRGGSWGDLAALCRSAYRVSHNPGARDFTIGFRLLRTS